MYSIIRLSFFDNKKADEGNFVRFYYSSTLYLSSTTTITAAAIPTAIVAPSVAVTTRAWTTASAGTIFLARFCGCPAFEHGLTGESDLALRVNVSHHHGDLVTHAHHIFHFVHAFGSQL